MRHDEWMNKHGIGYSVEFVPFSKSRNAKPNPKLSDLSINWRVTLTKGGRAFTTDYMQGIGHLPESVRVPWKGANINRLVLAHEPIVMAAIERNVIQIAGDFGLVRPGAHLAPPAAADVLQCLALDANVLEAGDFETWADDYGYDKDSRAAEAIYNEARDQTLRMRAVIGAAALMELQAIPEE